MTLGRRRFLQAMFGAACGVAIGDEVLDALDAVAPRPVMVPGADFGGRYSDLRDMQRMLADSMYGLHVGALISFPVDGGRRGIYEQFGRVHSIDRARGIVTVEWGRTA